MAGKTKKKKSADKKIKIRRITEEDLKATVGGMMSLDGDVCDNKDATKNDADALKKCS